MVSTSSSRGSGSVGLGASTLAILPTAFLSHAGTLGVTSWLVSGWHILTTGDRGEAKMLDDLMKLWDIMRAAILDMEAAGIASKADGLYEALGIVKELIEEVYPHKP